MKHYYEYRDEWESNRDEKVGLLYIDNKNKENNLFTIHFSI